MQLLRHVYACASIKGIAEISFVSRNCEESIHNAACIFQNKKKFSEMVAHGLSNNMQNWERVSDGVK